MEKLFLITQFYPFDNTEEPFIFPELVRLKTVFDVTVIVAEPIENKKIVAKFPSDVKLLCFSKEEDKFVWRFNKYIGCNLSRICREAKSVGECNKRFYIKGKTFEHWFRKKKLVEKEESFLIYSYWYLWWNLGFAINKNKYPNMKLITRTHRFDLYDDSHRDGRQPFRKFLDTKLDKIVFVSKMGLEYYLNNHAQQPLEDGKYIVSYLGQEDVCGDGYVKPESKEFRLVSCSRVIPFKRVELIAQALGEINTSRPVRWVHFGDGASLEGLKKEAERALLKNVNLSIDIRGKVKNTEVLKYYKKEGVDAFISTSSSEGLPVSISEAMSFGIPIIATDAGGIREQIDGNGILLPVDASVREIKEAIELVVDLDKESLQTMGDLSRSIWKEKFSIDNNVARFIEELC